MSPHRLPNLLTMLRLLLAIVFFVLLHQYQYDPSGAAPQTLLIWSSMALFGIAVGTDWLDGYLARRWQVESPFGRIMDPLCDKILILGTFISLSGPTFAVADPASSSDQTTMISGIYPWMILVLLMREMLVTGIRSEMESQGHAFGANWSGKAKMFAQSIAIPLLMLLIWLDPIGSTLLTNLRDGLIYLTLFLTILSGLPYVINTYRILTTPRNPQK